MITNANIIIIIITIISLISKKITLHYTKKIMLHYTIFSLCYTHFLDDCSHFLNNYLFQCRLHKQIVFQMFDHSTNH